ncbi:hypothetical protein C8Q72DRAFT_29790 [Fomitopsis betulina]|nr:hypothetical protein C8Q72DRAFT_29790 [Fomitopsis betulina]
MRHLLSQQYIVALVSAPFVRGTLKLFIRSEARFGASMYTNNSLRHKGGNTGSSCPTYAEYLSEDIAADLPADDSPGGSLATVFSIYALNLDIPLDRTGIAMNGSIRCCDVTLDVRLSQGELIPDAHRCWPCTSVSFRCTTRGHQFQVMLPGSAVISQRVSPRGLAPPARARKTAIRCSPNPLRSTTRRGPQCQSAAYLTSGSATASFIARQGSGASRALLPGRT